MPKETNRVGQEIDMLKVLFIDIDDTLLSFTECVKEAMKTGFQKYGLKPYTEEMFPVFEKINNGLWRQIERGELDLPGLEAIRWNLIFEALGISFDGAVFERYFKEQLFSSAILEPHAMEFLQYLSERYVLCAASNGPYKQQKNRLKIAGMYDYFSHFFISSKVGAEKPAGAFFDYCFEELRNEGMAGLRPEETMIIGDSLTSDMAGGRQYGMKTCLYSPNSRPDAEVDYVIGDLMEITDIL